MAIIEVVLTNDVLGLGDIGEKVNVKSGYARNYLIPQGLAFETKSRKGRQIQHKMMQVEAKSKKLKAEAEELANKIRNAEVKFKLKKSRSGKIFGSISPKDLSEKLSEQNLEVDKKRFITGGSIKQEGTSLIDIKLHPEVNVQLKVIIETEQASQSQEDGEVEEILNQEVEEATE